MLVSAVDTLECPSRLPIPFPARWDLGYWDDWGSLFLGAGPLPEDEHHTLVPCVMGHLFCILL